jgi:hypothetical protein
MPASSESAMIARTNNDWLILECDMGPPGIMDFGWSVLSSPNVR